MAVEKAGVISEVAMAEVAVAVLAVGLARGALAKEFLAREEVSADVGRLWDMRVLSTNSDPVRD